MSLKARTFIVSNIKLTVNASFQEAFSVAKGRLSRFVAIPSDAEYRIAKRSVDARDKNDICFVYPRNAYGGGAGALFYRVIQRLVLLGRSDNIV